MESLRVSLETYYADVVNIIAAANHIPDVEEHTKAALVNRLVKEIPRRAGDPDWLASLSDEERAVLAVVLEQGGQTTPADIAVPLALGGLVSLENMKDAPDGLPNLVEVLQSLLRQGVLVNLTPPVDRATRRNFSPLRDVAIPPEVVRVLPQQHLRVPDPQPDVLLTPPPARVEQYPISDLLRNLFFIWAELRREPASALKAGGIYKRDARRLARSMSISFSENEDEIRFLVDLLSQMRLLTETYDEVYATETEEAQDFWTHMPVVQARRLLTAIIDTVPDLTFDFSSLQMVRSYVYQMVQPRPIDMLFAEITELFGQMTENVWFPLRSFLALLTGGRAGTFLFSQQVVADLHQRLRWYGLHGNMAAREKKLDQALLAVERQASIRLLQHLQRLGVVILGYDTKAEAAPTALRPSPLVHAALTGRPYDDLGGKVGQIILQPDFQLLAMGPVALKTLSHIEYIAEREKVQPAAVAYRITRDSVYRALQNDKSLSDILHFLEEATEMPLPQNVARTLHEWGAQHERIVLRQPVMILQVDRPERLQTLQHDPDIGPIVHPLDATTAWVPSRSALKIERRLWELEMLPALSQGRDADLPHSLRWDGDGRLSARHPLPSLYVVGNVERFAEPVDDGWRLTPKSVREAVSAGLDVTEVIALVEKMTGVALSKEWEKRLKAWGGYYGDAQTARVRLLRFETDEAVAELRKMERRLRRRLHPVGEQDGALVVVEEQHWDEVQMLLEEWGIVVEEDSWW